MKTTHTARESPAVERIRTARRAVAKESNYDAGKLGEMLLERQSKSKQKYLVPAKKTART